MSHPLIDVYRRDKDGWLDEVSCAQFIEPLGRYVIPDDCTTVAPAFEEGYWYKWDASRETWTAHKIPSTPEECVALGMLPHYDQTKHEMECVAVMRKLCEQCDTHRIERGSNLEWYVVEIPKPTAEELALKAAEQKKATAQYNLSSTDYVAAKIAEGAATREEYADVLAKRVAWREEVNAADVEIASLKAKGV